MPQMWIRGSWESKGRGSGSDSNIGDAFQFISPGHHGLDPWPRRTWHRARPARATRLPWLHRADALHHSRWTADLSASATRL